MSRGHEYDAAVVQSLESPDLGAFTKLLSISPNHQHRDHLVPGCCRAKKLARLDIFFHFPSAMSPTLLITPADINVKLATSFSWVLLYVWLVDRPTQLICI